MPRGRKRKAATFVPKPWLSNSSSDGDDDVPEPGDVLQRMEEDPPAALHDVEHQQPGQHQQEADNPNFANDADVLQDEIEVNGENDGERHEQQPHAVADVLQDEIEVNGANGGPDSEDDDYTGLEEPEYVHEEQEFLTEFDVPDDLDLHDENAHLDDEAGKSLLKVVELKKKKKKKTPFIYYYY